MALIRKPKSVEQLKQLRGKATSRRRVTAFDLSRIADPQSTPKAQGQWLPVDPPRPARFGIGGLISGNAIGLHRFRLRTVRDDLMGIKWVWGDGSESNSEGRVVKNLAGVDLPKLSVGSRGSLGVVLKSRFTLAPLPGARLVYEGLLGSSADSAAVCGLTEDLS